MQEVFSRSFLGRSIISNQLKANTVERRKMLQEVDIQEGEKREGFLSGGETVDRH